MYFGIFIDSSGDWVDSVHFPEAAQKQQLTGRGFYQLKGKVMEEFGVYSIEVKWLQKRGIKKILFVMPYSLNKRRHIMVPPMNKPRRKTYGDCFINLIVTCLPS
jgi:hypothetical protein